MSTVFTYAAASGSSLAESVDLAKLLGKDTSMVKLNTWINNQPQAAKNVALTTPFDQAFTDYGLVWTAERMDFYVNGQVVYSITDPEKIPTARPTCSSASGAVTLTPTWVTSWTRARR